MVFENMKLLWILAVSCLAVTASPFEEDKNRLHGENGWYVPSLDGSLKWVDSNNTEYIREDSENVEKFGLSMTPVKFLLYTRSNPKKGKKITTSTKSIAASNFNASHPTRFVIHGWTHSYLNFINKDIRNAWLSVGEFNVIFVDWARARSVDYASSVWAVPTVGKKLANMIDFLVKNYGMSLDTLHVVGHSLGAHVAGYAGKNVATGKIHTIVGLDPALPLFSYNKPKKRLSTSDAVYVESIQTNGGELGFLKPIGVGAFYPNGGKSQPGCPLDVAGICAHARAITYYAEAVAKDNFATIKCEGYQDAVANNCGSTYSPVRMVADTNALMVSGEYYVPVKKKSPYGVMDYRFDS